MADRCRIFRVQFSFFAEVCSKRFSHPPLHGGAAMPATRCQLTEFGPSCIFGALVFFGVKRNFVTVAHVPHFFTVLYCLQCGVLMLLSCAFAMRGCRGIFRAVAIHIKGGRACWPQR